MGSIVERIVREAGVPDLLEVLSERLSPTDLQSLLLEVYRRRAESGDVAGLLERYRSNRFAKPSAVAPDVALEFDRIAISELPPDFHAIELSPVAPLGATSVVTGTSQNRIVSTARNTEVAADPTNALALECAVRRHELLAGDARSRVPVKLATSQRLVRAQKSDDPLMLAHFRLFALCAAGRDTGSFSFELGALPEQIAFYLRLLEAWRERGAGVGSLRVPVTPLPGGPSDEAVEREVLEPLRSAHPDVEFLLHPERTQGRGYYRTACFHVYGQDPSDRLHQLADGGFTDWTQQLVGSRKERLLISGIGSERVVGEF